MQILFNETGAPNLFEEPDINHKFDMQNRKIKKTPFI